jgi:CheY-like chemotaxis protein
MAQSYRVLIVEDDPDMQDVGSQVLGYAGYDVVQARNGLEALATLREQEFNVILLDLMMPVMDGLTFLAERRRLGLGEGIPVVCVSAAAGEMLTQAQRLGACVCMQKPADFDRLCDIVAHYCGQP